jgi:transcriptional regulator of acetoin/glycerol metabolism
MEGKTLKEILDQVEQVVIMDHMVKTGNMSAVARTLGVDRSTIFRKMKRYESETS